MWNESVGSLSNNDGDGDGDGNEDVKKAIGLLGKTTTLREHQAFLYISLLSMHDDRRENTYNCKFYGGRKQGTNNFFFSL